MNISNRPRGGCEHVVNCGVNRLCEDRRLFTCARALHPLCYHGEELRMLLRQVQLYR
jgi:hypothetical protein